MLALVAIISSATAAETFATPARSAVACEALPLKPPVVRGLRAAFLRTNAAYRRGGARLARRGFARPSYGRCGRRFYAVATFSPTVEDLPIEDAVSYQDQPHEFVRRAGARWRDRGDTGGVIACASYPAALIEAWRRPCVAADGELRYAPRGARLQTATYR